MKKISLIALALGAAAIFACDPYDNSTTTSDYVAPELALSDTTVTLGSGAGAKTTVTVTTDQSVISVSVDYSAKSWLTAKVEGDVVTITATAKNPEKEPRTGVVLVTVGEKGVTAEKYIEVTQSKNSLSLADAEITLGMGADSGKDVAIDSELSGLTATVSSDAASWLKAVIDGKTLKVSVLSENVDETPRSGVITVSAGGVDAVLNVTQSGNVPTLEISPADSVTYNKWAGNKSNLTITSNKTPVLKLSDGADAWLSYTYNEGALAISAIANNDGTEDRVATITITAGSLEKTVTIIQKAAKGLVGTKYKTEGIIFWVDPENAKHVKVMAAQAQACAWCTEKGRVDGVGSSMTAQEANDIIRAKSGFASGEYPAFKYCYDKGPEWLIPTTGEAEFIAAAYCGVDAYADVFVSAIATDPTAPVSQLNARKAFDKMLTDMGGSVMNPAGYDANGDSIHICRETSGGAQYSFRFGKIGSLNTHAKNGTARIARCIKEVTLE